MALSMLVSLEAVKSWLAISSTDDDGLLTNLIADVSRSIHARVNRPFFLPKNLSEVYDGRCNQAFMLRQWPVICVQSVTMNGQTAPKAPGNGSFGSGWFVQNGDEEPPGGQQMLQIRGMRFTAGLGNIAVNYQAGYQISGEAQIVPAGLTLTANQPYGAWGSDVSVSFANGSAMSAVAMPVTSGQYAVSEGVYSFSAADSGAQILLNYGYVPADIARAALEWIADRYRYRDRIGLSSKSLGGQETISYQVAAIPDFVNSILQNYARVFA